MRYILIYILVNMFFMFGCKTETHLETETPTNKENLASILNSQNYKLTIKSCHGGIVGGVSCYDEIILFKNNTLVYYNGDETYIKRIDNSKLDSLNSYYYKLLDYQQPDKNIEKVGFGCMYHDYDFTFEKDTLKLIIKPREGNGIYYKIQKLIAINYYYEYISGHIDGMSIDSVDLDKIINHKIVAIRKLICINNNNRETLGGLNLKLLCDTSSILLSILPTPNPGVSLKKLSPYLKFQGAKDFNEFEIMPERNIQSVNGSDSLLNKVLGLRILKIKFEFKPNTGPIDKSLSDPYGIRFKDRYVMTLYFENKIRLFIENEGLSLDIYE